MQEPRGECGSFFLHCAVAQKLWSLVFCPFGVFLGDALFYFGNVIMLDGMFWKEMGRLESCSFAFNVLSLEREMIVALKERDEPNEVEDLIFEEFV